MRLLMIIEPENVRNTSSKTDRSTTGHRHLVAFSAAKDRVSEKFFTNRTTHEKRNELIRRSPSELRM
jgi:hypothetical protein